MKFLLNLRIGTKLIVSSALGMLLVVAMLVMQLLGNSWVNEARNGAAREQAVTGAAGEAKAAARGLQIGVKDLRLARMAEHFSRCGEALGRSVQSYNQLVGSLEHSVMPQARRFQELEVEGTGTELPLLQQIELQPRLLRPEVAVKDAKGSAQAA